MNPSQGGATAAWGLKVAATSLAPMNGYLKALKALESDSVVVADVWSLSGHILETKRYCDISANHVNHPSDFMVRIYAQVVLALFDTPAAERAIDVAR